MCSTPCLTNLLEFKFGNIFSGQYKFDGKAGKGKDSSEDSASGDYDDNCVDIDDEDDCDGQKGERVTWQKRRVSAPAAAALQLTAVQATLGE